MVALEFLWFITTYVLLWFLFPISSMRELDCGNGKG